MKRYRIFLIDDDTEFRESVAELLMEEDYLVDEAANGAVAIKQMAEPEYCPDLVLVDIAMPQMHGLEFIERVHKIDPVVPIVVCSSKSGLIDDYSLFSTGQVRKFLTKPVDIEDLLTTLKEILSEETLA
ncbi:response regulator [bacterium]|nr:response regulator [candidate division CSSED10-310 bacterium]